MNICTYRRVVERGVRMLETLRDALSGADEKAHTFGELKDAVATTRHHIDNIFQFEEPEFAVDDADFDWWDVNVVRPLEYAVGDFSEDYAIPSEPLTWTAHALACVREALECARTLASELTYAVNAATLRMQRLGPPTETPVE